MSLFKKKPYLYSKMTKMTDIFEPGFRYHIYNRAVGNDLLFPKEKNYSYFLSQIDKYFSDHLFIYAYCLMNNHYHFLTEVKETTSPQKVSEAFRRFGIGYSQSINKQEGRKGGLFMRPVKRKRVNSENYFKALVVYIHRNPVHHGVSKSFQDYPWSSYSQFIGIEESREGMPSLGVMTSLLYPTILQNPKELLNKYFEDEENFIYAHQKTKGFTSIEDLTIED